MKTVAIIEIKENGKMINGSFASTIKIERSRGQTGRDSVHSRETNHAGWYEGERGEE